VRKSAQHDKKAESAQRLVSGEGTGSSSRSTRTKKADRPFTLRTARKTTHIRLRRNLKRRMLLAPQNRSQAGVQRSRRGGRTRPTQNSGKTAGKRSRRKIEKADRGLLRRQRHFILEKLVGRSDKDAALAAGYSLWIATNTKQKIWAKPGVRVEYERLKAEIIEVYYDRLRGAINGTSASPDAGVRKELPLDSTAIAP
jgi:hypothetical protein